MWLTRPRDDTVRIRSVVGGAVSTIAIDLTANSAQVAEAELALAYAEPRAAALLTTGALRIGERRAVVAGPDGLSFDATLPVALGSLDRSPETPVCIDRLGARAVFIVPDGGRARRLDVSIGSGSTVEAHIDLDLQPPDAVPTGCHVEGSSVWTWGLDSHGQFVVVEERDGISIRHRVDEESILSAGPCGDGVVVTVDDHIVVVTSGATDVYVGDTGGCTPAGTPWTLQGRTPTWRPAP